VQKKPARQIKHENFLGVLGYFFDACRTGRVTAFASDLHLTRSGIAARFTTVFFATFHHTGAGDVGAGVLLRRCHKFLLRSPGMKRTLAIIARTLESSAGVGVEEVHFL